MSKFLKFREVLSISDTVELLSSLSGEEVSIEMIGRLVDHGFLSPLLGCDYLLVGFSKESAVEINNGADAEPYAFSEIGIPRLSTAIYVFGGIQMPQARTTEGETLFFCRVKMRSDSENLIPRYSSADLADLDPYELENLWFHAKEVFEMARIANQQDQYHPPKEGSSGSIQIGSPINIPGFEKIRFVHAIEDWVESYPICRTGVANRYSARERISNGEAPSYRLAIAALLELLKQPRQSGRNQSAVISELLEKYPGTRGLSKRSLETIFASANKALSEQS